jgi:hypothetical protein
MKSTFLKYSIFILPVFFLLSCKKKKKDEKVGNDPPTIELVSVTPGTAKEFKDSILIVIKYKDVNGDLGDDNPDELSLQVKDSRLQNYDAYHIKPLAPDIGKDISIEGDLKIKLNSLFLLGGGSTELATLTIKLKDRAGNWSNEISTQPIIITK